MGGGKRGASQVPAPQPEEAAGNGTTGSSGMLALHRSRCWDWDPSPVVAISACPDAPLAAVGYETGDLELWDLSHMVCVQRLVGEGVEVTALSWAKDSLDGSWRTFCAGLDGSLAEVSWKQSERSVASTDSGAGAIWSLAAQPASAVQPGFAHPLAAGCDDGSVRLFNVEAGEPGAHYGRTLARLQGRVLAVAWHPSGNALVAGGADGCIHALDPTTGIESLRITASVSTLRPVCVWRLAVLQDGTLVSADSDGAVQFWDGRHGTQVARFTQHAADVLALAVAPGGDAVFAAGVDSRVALFKRTRGGAGGSTGAGGSGSSSSWVYTHYKRPHSHDVRAMDCVPLGGGRALLLSGGLDAQLLAYPAASFLEEHPVRLSKCPQRPICALQQQGPLQLAPQQPQEQQQQAAEAEGARSTRKRKGSGAQAGGEEAGPSSAHLQGLAGSGQHTAAPLAPPRLLCAQHDTLDVWQVARTTASLHTPSQPPSTSNAVVLANGSGPGHHHHHGYHSGSYHHHQQQPGEGDPVEMSAGPRHLARVRCGAGRIAAAAISQDGTYVACVAGPGGATRVYQLGGSEGAAGSLGSPASVVSGGPGAGVLLVGRVRLPRGLKPASSLVFAAGGQVLVLGHRDGGFTALAMPGSSSHAGSTSNGHLANGSAPHSTSNGSAGVGPGSAGEAVLLARLSAHDLGTFSGSGAADAGSSGQAGGSSSSSGGKFNRGAWRGHAAAVSVMAASHSGDLLAAGGAAGIRLLQLRLPGHGSSSSPGAGALLPTGKLMRPPHDAPLTSLSFSADGGLLAATLASGHLSLYDTASGQLAPWILEHGAAVAACLERLPGAPTGCSFSPDPASRALLVFSPGGFCALDTALPPAPGLTEPAPRPKRQRLRPEARGVAGGVQRAGGAGPLLDAAAGGGGLTAKEAAALPARGSNGRTLLLRDPTALVAYLGPGEALLLEKCWEDVAAKFTAPLARHRYGA